MAQSLVGHRSNIQTTISKDYHDESLQNINNKIHLRFERLKKADVREYNGTFLKYNELMCLPLSVKIGDWD